MMLDFEYALFTKEDPIKLLKDSASKLPLHKRAKIAPYIRKANASVVKCKKFRDIITSDDRFVFGDIGDTFTRYFGSKIDKGPFLALPNKITVDYVYFLSTSCSDILSKDKFNNDKYMERIVNVILSHSDHINAFVRAFLNIRIAQGELDKLKSN